MHPDGNDISVARPSTHAVEALARIGARLGAQRVELYRVIDDEAERLAAWQAPVGEPGEAVPMRLAISWFPWSLGNVRAAEHLFVRNAGELPLHPDGSAQLRDLGMGSALHLPLRRAGALVGAVCAYWRNERDAWDCDAARPVDELALDLLSRTAPPR